ncbi:MAG: DUF420 domain-containing protein [Pyrinomonadaceae bacterium]
MDFLHIFPHLNATLNALSSVFLLCGFYFILQRRVREHRFCMLSASSVSAVFLVGYLTHHAIRTYYFGIGPTKFTAEGIIQPIYKTILLSHTVLAVVIFPFVILTLVRGLRGRFDAHRKIARVVFPIWLYVSLTGVVVYLLLYQIYPAR